MHPPPACQAIELQLLRVLIATSGPAGRERGEMTASLGLEIVPGERVSPELVRGKGWWWRWWSSALMVRPSRADSNCHGGKCEESRRQLLATGPAADIGPTGSAGRNTYCHGCTKFAVFSHHSFNLTCRLFRARPDPASGLPALFAAAQKGCC